MFKSTIVHLPKDIYIDKVDGFLLIYNPTSTKGITILNKEATYLFKLINNKRTVKEIYSLAKKKDYMITISVLKKIFNDFLESQILRIAKQKKEIPLDNPRRLYMWFHITNQCNLRCKYCYLWKTPDKMTLELAEKAIKKILKDAKNNDFKSVFINFAGGECLLELSKIISLIKFGRKLAQKMKIEIIFSMLTNGVLVTPEIAKILRENKIGVNVSLDGIEKYHDAQRVFADGSGSFKFVIKGIDNLLANNIRPKVLITVTSKNIVNLPALTKYLLNRNIRFSYDLFRENPCAQNGLNASDATLIKYLKKSLKIIYDNVPSYSLMEGLLDLISIKGERLFGCGVGRNYLAVGYDGNLASCQMTFDQPIGSINDRDIVKTMFKGGLIKPNELTIEKKQECMNCQWRYACCGGCPMLTFITKRTFQSRSPYCNVYKTLIPEIIRIEAKRLIKLNTLN